MRATQARDATPRPSSGTQVASCVTQAAPPASPVKPQAKLTSGFNDAPNAIRICKASPLLFSPCSARGQACYRTKESCWICLQNKAPPPLSPAGTAMAEFESPTHNRARKTVVPTIGCARRQTALRLFLIGTTQLCSSTCSCIWWRPETFHLALHFFGASFLQLLLHQTTAD